MVTATAVNSISILSPENGAQFKQNSSVMIKARVNDPHRVSRVEFYVAGQQVGVVESQSFDQSDFHYDWTTGNKDQQNLSVEAWVISKNGNIVESHNEVTISVSGKPAPSKDWSKGSKPISSSSDSKTHGCYTLTAQNVITMAMGSNIGVTLGNKSTDVIGENLAVNIGLATKVNLDLEYTFNAGGALTLKTYQKDLKGKYDSLKGRVSKIFASQSQLGDDSQIVINSDLAVSDESIRTVNNNINVSGESISSGELTINNTGQVVQTIESQVQEIEVSVEEIQSNIVNSEMLVRSLSVQLDNAQMMIDDGDMAIRSRALTIDNSEIHILG
ncbi:Ig-like domain-containing protein [Dongshaea marina]|uniref:Ig-like domain-containing protein n=1 Tax=Dongshaea marina TaxID=2047966 RepID=UPI000D3ED463|nr:Ig-like domain-containing protein [Dongshaea marina]